MNRPIKKNHFIYEQITDFDWLIAILVLDPIIYIASEHSVRATGLIRQTWPREKILKMAQAGEFWRAISKNDVQRMRIRNPIHEAMEQYESIIINKIHSAIDRQSDEFIKSLMGI